MLQKEQLKKQQKQLVILLVIKLKIKLRVFLKTSPKELHSQNEDKIEILKERNISPRKRKQIIDELN